MAIIGNTVTSVPFIADSFSGNASTTSFSPLTRAPAGTAAIAVFIAGVYQAPGTYTLSGTTITFSSAPASGVGNIIVLHLGTGSTTQVPSDGSVTTIKLSNDTYSYINAAFTSANAAFATANTGTASGSYANSAFATANTGTAAGSYANSAFTVANNSLGIDTTQNTNITNASTYANAAFATANTGSASGSYANSAFAVANNGVGIDATQNTNITNASTYANSAFAKANTAGTGTVTSVATGNGLSGGTITSTGTLVIAAPSYNSVGSYVYGFVTALSTAFSAGDTKSAGASANQVQGIVIRNFGCGNEFRVSNNLSGTWRMMLSNTDGGGGGNVLALMVRVS